MHIYDDYIIDFDRINELTTHPNDNPNSTGFTQGTFCYGITQRLVNLYSISSEQQN